MCECMFVCVESQHVAGLETIASKVYKAVVCVCVQLFVCTYVCTFVCACWLVRVSERL